MKTIKTRGLVLRSIDYKDTSKIVYLLSPYGILSIKALGAKKYKNKAYNFNESLTYVECEITDCSFPTLVEYSIIDRFDDLKSDLNKMLIYSYFLEFLTKIPTDCPFEKILDYAIKTIKLGRLYECFSLILMFQVKMLPLFGIKPEFSHCFYCNKKPIFIDIKSGETFCELHNKLHTYNLSSIDYLYHFNLKADDFKEVEKINVSYVLDFITTYYIYHADLRLKSLDSLKLIIKF